MFSLVIILLGFYKVVLNSFKLPPVIFYEVIQMVSPKEDNRSALIVLD